MKPVAAFIVDVEQFVLKTEGLDPYEVLVSSYIYSHGFSIVVRESIRSSLWSP